MVSWTHKNCWWYSFSTSFGWSNEYVDEVYLVAHGFHTCFNESINSTYVEFIPKCKYYKIYCDIGISLTVVSRNEGKQGIKLLRDAILYALKKSSYKKIILMKI